MESREFSIFMSRSNTSTAINKTGSWRFMRPVYSEKNSPCSTACPAGADVAQVQMLAASGHFAEAGQRLLQENPFPAVCGYVCFQPCEIACHRARFDEAVAIRRIEKFIGRHLIETAASTPYASLGKNSRKVAIVGAGPAGLSAAYFLRCLGYDCEVFEAQAEPGGLLRWGIPDYRLPLDVLRSEIARIERMGIPIHCRRPVDVALRQDLSDRFAAVFVGCGHSQSLGLPIQGAAKVVDGLDFLKQLRSEARVTIQGRAAVIGGGNSAIDVARSLVRLGVETVVVYRRRQEDMPAFSAEVDRALAEGVKIKELFTPLQIEPQQFGFKLTLQVMKVANVDGQGQQAMVVAQAGRTQGLQVDHVFTAIGAEANPAWLPPPKGFPDTIHLSHCVLAMYHQKPVVYGGDLANRIRSVADAIASGKQAAMALDTYFTSGWNAVRPQLKACQIGRGQSPSMEIYTNGPRRVRQDRMVAFGEINLDYFRPIGRVAVGASSVEARSEAQRCFNCGICDDCDNCRLFCPEVAVKMTENGRRINLDYCKGCGICVTECPRDAMVLVPETQ